MSEDRSNDQPVSDFYFRDCNGHNWYEDDDGTYAIYFGQRRVFKSVLHHGYKLSEVRRQFGPIVYLSSEGTDK